MHACPKGRSHVTSSQLPSRFGRLHRPAVPGRSTTNGLPGCFGRSNCWFHQPNPLQMVLSENIPGFCCSSWQVLTYTLIGLMVTWVGYGGIQWILDIVLERKLDRNWFTPFGPGRQCSRVRSCELPSDVFSCLEISSWVPLFVENRNVTYLGSRVSGNALISWTIRIIPDSQCGYVHSQEQYESRKRWSISLGPRGQNMGYLAGMIWGICCSQATKFQRGGTQMDANFQSSLPKLPSYGTIRKPPAIACVYIYIYLFICIFIYAYIYTCMYIYIY